MVLHGLDPLWALVSVDSAELEIASPSLELSGSVVLVMPSLVLSGMALWSAIKTSNHQCRKTENFSQIQVDKTSKNTCMSQINSCHY